MEVLGIGNATGVAAGKDDTCAVLSGGQIDCWGDNSSGELGNGTTNNSDTPVEVQGISNAGQVTAGGEHTCAALSGGQIDCWGDNFQGALGDGAETSSDTPVEVQGIGNAIQVTAGYYHTCAVRSSGQIDCWGDNSSGELGNGDAWSVVPIEVLLGAPLAVTENASPVTEVSAMEVSATLNATMNPQGGEVTSPANSTMA